jgi:glycosyltransferase involved in cell wall biosynthesis
MKIAFVNEGIYEFASGAPEAVGGLERDQWLLARALAVTGWSATVGVRGALRAGERRVIDKVEYVGIDQGPVLLAWHRFLSSERPDWLFWEGATHLWGPLVEIAKLAGVRTVFHVAFDRDVEPHRALVHRRRCWPLYAWGLARTDRIFVQHAGQLAKLASRWRSKAYILPKVCMLSGSLAEPVTIKAHAERARYVAWVAMLRQPKRPDVLIEIARKASAIRFVVCGGPTAHRSPPGYGERIVEALRMLPNVEYRGQVASAEAMQVVADAAVLLSTSDEEGFPNTFTQAWSVGTPVVSLKIDPGRVIERVGLGMVSGSLDRAIADINALMDSPQRREEIATRARQYIAERHSEAAVMAAFERTIQGIGR